MTSRIMKFVAYLVVRRPILVVLGSVVLTVVLYAHIHSLRLGTDLTNMFGNKDPEWNVISQVGRELGYGNQLFVVVEAPPSGEGPTEQMEAAADRLVAEMTASGRFKYARCGLTEDEILRTVRYFTWNFPSFISPAQKEDLKRQLEPRHIREALRRASAEFVTPFSSLGTNYFIADPVGIMEVAGAGNRGFSEFQNFDFTWGSGNRFFSKDHRALLIIAAPGAPAVDYQYAGAVVQWTRDRIRDLSNDPEFRDSRLNFTPAGAYVYAEQDHQFIARDMRFVSLLSILGNFALCLVIYPRIPLFLLSLLPTSLGILWTTGIASYYPGELNMISLSFIAILAGLGDDQVVHFFNRVPQEWSRGGTLEQAVYRTFDTTGRSILFCTLTAAIATASLGASSFKALSEFGFILTVGLLMMFLHTVLTVPSLMRLWWRVSKPRAPETITFRFLPYVARATVDFVGRHPKLVAASGILIFVMALCSLPAVKMVQGMDVALSEQNPAITAQNRLSEKFGIEGSPQVFLISGGEEEVLRRVEQLTGALDGFRERGVVKSVFSPATLVPSRHTQTERARALAGVDFNAAADALEESIHTGGFRPAPFQPFVDRLRALGHSAPPVTVESAIGSLPQGLLDNSIRRTSDKTYLAAIAYYPTDPNATDVVPASTIASWRHNFGAFVDFSYDKMNREVQDRVLHDSNRALLMTATGIFVIVYLCFRTLRMSLMVLLPIVFAIAVTFLLLLLVGHRFTFMAITGIPLIIGIGIDNGIHLIRRYLESDRNTILDVAKASGAALIQSNLTTIVGFGALMASSFRPLAEMGLVTALGVALALACSLWVVPAVILVSRSGWQPQSGTNPRE
ncbi:MAG: MMPL family transporter [Chloroflexi bacterium]|nr:MMPL family transporter [Chloroflexota bacterium]